MTQLPHYKTGEREMGAPAGYQPPRPDGPPAQTQANNGGPMGLGQPARSTPQAAPPMTARGHGAPAPAGPPPPGRGQPPNIYGQPAAPDPRADLWANRNSREPLELILQAFMQFQGRAPQPQEVQTLLQLPSTDMLVQQLFNLQQPGQMSPVQSAVLGR